MRAHGLPRPRAALSPAGVIRHAAAKLALWLRAVLSSDRVRPGQKRPAWARPGVLLFGAVFSVALVVVAMVTLDAVAIAWQRELPAWTVSVFARITEFGRSGWVLIPCASLIVALAAASSAPIGAAGQRTLAALAARVGYLFTAVAVPGLLVTIGKRVIGRARPRASGIEGALTFRLWHWDAAYASLPSGHSTSAFATAFALAALFPRWRVLWWTFAGLIAVSRVAIAAHYPSDVIAGAVVGLLGAIVVRNWFAVRRLAFVVAPDRSVRALPGPPWRRLRAVVSRALAR